MMAFSLQVVYANISNINEQDLKQMGYLNSVYKGHVTKMEKSLRACTTGKNLTSLHFCAI